jgi:membrane fusion protein (multidrug efflux system)
MATALAENAPASAAVAAQFSRTTRSLAGDSSALALLAWGLAGLLLSGWLLWFVLGRVTVYEVSHSARLEVQQSANPVAALVAGRLQSSALVLGQSVHAGDVLARLDASHETLRLAEEQSRLDAYGPRLQSLGREMAALRQAQSQDQQTLEAALRAARARSQEAAVGMDFARENERRLKEDSRAGGAAQVDALRAGSEAQKQSAAHDALLADALRLEGDARSRRSQQQAQIENLERALVTLEGNRNTTASSMARLQQEIAQLELRAPIDGVVAELQTLAAGSYVSAGQKIATVVPRGALVIVAEFAPSAVLGRIRVGQSARMRLDGFAWTEFGSLPAEVTHVASEIRDQTVRVELRPLPEANSRLVLQHGLPGTVEVRLEDSAPATLILRSVGQVSRP